MNVSNFKINLVIIILFLAGFITFISSYIFEINKIYTNLILDLLVLILGLMSIQRIFSIFNLVPFFIVFSIFIILVYTQNSEKSSFWLTLNGLREYIAFFMFPIIFIDFLESNKANYFRKLFDTFLYTFLIIQLPVTIWQFSNFGSGDDIGGTLGSGNSGVLTLTIYLSTFYLIMKDFEKDNLKTSLIKKWYLFLFWIPSLINETKISILLIVIFFLFLIEYRFSIKSLSRIMLMTFLILFGGLIFSYVYSNTNSITFDSILDSNYIVDYLSLSNPFAYKIGYDIPRFSKIEIFFSAFNIENLFYGNGLGHFKGGSMIANTSFYNQYSWLLNGSRPTIFFNLLQIGLVGIILINFYLYKLIRYVWTNKKNKNSNNILLFSFFCYTLIQFYNDSFRGLFFCGVFMFILICPIYNYKNEN